MITLINVTELASVLTKSDFPIWFLVPLSSLTGFLHQKTHPASASDDVSRCVTLTVDTNIICAHVLMYTHNHTVGVLKRDDSEHQGEDSQPLICTG